MVRRKAVTPKQRGNTLTGEQKRALQEVAMRLIARFGGQKQLAAELKKRFDINYSQSSISRLAKKGEGGSIPIAVLLYEIDDGSIFDFLGVKDPRTRLARDMPLHVFTQLYNDARFARLRSWVTREGNDVTVGEMILALEPLEEEPLIEGVPDGGWPHFFERLRAGEFTPKPRVRGRTQAIQRAQAREVNALKE